MLGAPPNRYNKRLEDFQTKREYDDYLEEREDIGRGLALPYGGNLAAVWWPFGNHLVTVKICRALM